MKHVTLLALLAFLVFGCGGDNKPEDFGTLAEAQAAVAENQGNIEIALALAQAAAAEIDFDGSFGGAIFLKPRDGKPSKFRKPFEDTATFNPSTGFWTFESHEEEITEDGTATGDFRLQLRFTERDANGFSTPNTDKMEYKADVDFSLVGTGTSFNFGYNSEMAFTGLQGFNAATGNAVLNGSTDLFYDIIASGGGQTYTIKYKYAIDYNGLTISSQSDPPVSGSIDFTIKLSSNIPEYENYYVAGTITFDGDNTALLTFGGFNFIINLETGDITAA